MDPAEVPFPGHPAQEGADRDILAGIGMAHAKRDNAPEIAGRQAGAGHGCPVLDERDKPAQDISPPLLHPDKDVRCSRRDARTEDPAAEPALLAGFLFRFRIIHAISSPFSSGIWTKVCIGSVLCIDWWR
jgi:hypothetical protein